MTAEIISEARERDQKSAACVFVPTLVGTRDLRDVDLAALKGNFDDARRPADAELESRSEALP